MKQILEDIGYFHDQLVFQVLVGEDLVVQIAIYNTFEGNIFRGSALKPQNLVDLIALKSNLGKYQFSTLKFSLAQLLMLSLFNIVQMLRSYHTSMMKLFCENS